MVTFGFVTKSISMGFEASTGEISEMKLKEYVSVMFREALTFG
jgi:hypothetical protein